MSSFKRKGTSKPGLPTYSGTRTSPGSTQTLITSTGISSLDDILGGGLPLSCSLVIAAPDKHSSYGELVLKYFAAQGLVAGHKVCLIGGAEELSQFVRECMWLPKGSNSTQEAEEDEEGNDLAQKVKIAWRYEKMKQFKTTVGSSSLDGESYCQTFDLSSTIPEEVVNDAIETDRLHLIGVSKVSSSSRLLEAMSKFVSSDTSAPVRVCIPSLGSPVWSDLATQDVMYFLHSLRARLREHGHGCAITSLPAHLSAQGDWLEKVGWVSDGLLSLSAFTANPGLSNMFPSHHGLVQIYTLPSPHMLIAPSDRFSILRGLTSSGENNLAFKCTRRRMVIETLHLDVEGGTGERRTTASKLMPEGAPVGVTKEEKSESVALVEVQVEGSGKSPKNKKTKKVVGFQSDRPELYEF